MVKEKEKVYPTVSVWDFLKLEGASIVLVTFDNEEVRDSLKKVSSPTLVLAVYSVDKPSFRSLLDVNDNLAMVFVEKEELYRVYKPLMGIVLDNEYAKLTVKGAYSYCPKLSRYGGEEREVKWEIFRKTLRKE